MIRSPVLVLDDDAVFLGYLAEALGAVGFGVTTAGTVAEAEAMVRHGSTRFEMLVLDVTLPDGDGCDLCARLRVAGLHTPIVMLTGSNADDDIVRGLEAGAHDYVAKPCATIVLVARLRTQLRLHQNSLDAVFSLGPWLFHPAQKLLQGAKGAKVWLTAMEVEILRFMLRVGGIVSKQSLLTKVWSYNSSTSTHTLETHIYRLRQKIEPNPYVPRLLLTVDGGYQLAGT